MATMSVARALTKLKTVQKRILDKIKFIEVYGGSTTKARSLLGSSMSIGESQEEAKRAISAAIQSIQDLQKYYTELLLAIQDSNLKATIQTNSMGPISVARALIISKNLRGQVADYHRALRSAMNKAEQEAKLYNMQISPTVQKDLDTLILEQLQAHPVIFFDIDVLQRAEDQNNFITTELNALINESNASTIIEVPDEV